MMRLSAAELRQSLAEILNRAEYQEERIIINRRGKDVAALVPLEDLRLLERLIEEAEDRLDIKAGGLPYPSPRTASLTLMSAESWGSMMSQERNGREHAPRRYDTSRSVSRPICCASHGAETFSA